jgi:anaerobic selenocysteine-containing dehydrogenase
MKNLSKLGSALTKSEQKAIVGGFCSPQFIQCSDDRDCPFCSSGCGINITLPDGTVLNVPDLCAF